VERRRVVVTGMGIICPTGNTVAEAWQNAAAGKSGIGPLTGFDASQLETRFGGEVKGFDPVAFLGARDARRTDRLSHFALYAAEQAIQDSGLKVTPENHYEIGVITGTGIGGIASLIKGVFDFMNEGAKSISPFLVTMMLPDAPSTKISMRYGMRGPNLALVTACATGNNCIGEATEIIRRGQAIAMLAGSSEAALLPLPIACFNNMTAISRRNDAPEKASRPFDANRDGFVVGEGAAIVMLEELDHALARNAKIYG